MATFIIKNGKEEKFCPNCSIKDQLKDAEMVKITVLDDNGDSGTDFLFKINKDILYSQLPPIPIKVERQNSIIGAKIARQAKTVYKRMQFYNLVEKLIFFEKFMDKSLSDIINYINNKRE